MVFLYLIVEADFLVKICVDICSVIDRLSGLPFNQLKIYCPVCSVNGI